MAPASYAGVDLYAAGNRARPRADYLGMRCEQVRESLSARLDGEAMPLPAPVVDAHLRDCSSCPVWLAGAERVTRNVRVQAVEVPDLTASILAAVRADGTLPSAGSRPAGGRGRTRGLTGWAAPARLRPALRVVLGVLAVIQLMMAMPILLGSIGHQSHSGREVAAFDIAVAVGLLLVSWYPEHARIFNPVILTLVVCLASASALDMLQGVVSPGHVAGHLLAIGQAGLVWLLSRTGRTRAVAW
ncbi:MAG TPA: zf-HC2 domain-containing protein [Micromonosporaceae bacterium]